jgi:hypothetical protein
MANKRVSELVNINANELTIDDLLLLADVSAHESKKMSLSALNTFLASTANSGSFYGTASWATVAVSALSAPAPATASFANTSSWAFNVQTASYVTQALTASLSNTASLAVNATNAATASYVSGISSVGFATTASHLWFNTLIPNGTASFAMTASLTRGTASFATSASRTTGTASFSTTSSHALYAVYALTAGSGSGGTSTNAVSASFASSSHLAAISTQSLSASHLRYDGVPNGTASYAMVAGVYPDVRRSYGNHRAISQSAEMAQLDHFLVDGVNSDGEQSCSFQAFGTLHVVSDVNTSTTGSIEFVAFNRWTGLTQSIDSSPIDVVISAGSSGSITYPFSLAGEVSISGSYALYVTCSGNVKPIINGARTVRFSMESLGTISGIRVAETMSVQFRTGAGLSPLFAFSSSGVLYSGNDADLVSHSLAVTEINASTKVLETVKYVWNLPALTHINLSGNPTLSDIGGMPTSIVSMSVQSCNLPSLAPMSHTSLGYLNCANNVMSALPSLPNSVTYINCTNNGNIIALPDPLPTSLKVLIAEGIGIGNPPTALPSGMISMSVSDNLSLNSWSTSFPATLAYFQCETTSLTSLPSMPAAMKYLNVSDCQLTSAAIDNLTTQLVANGVSNGVLDISSNLSGAYSATTLSNIALLQAAGWNVTS